MPIRTKEEREEYERKFRELSAKLDHPDVQNRVEALTRANIDRAARIHNRILMRSRVAAQSRIVYR